MQEARLSADTLKEDDKVNWKFIPAQDGRPAYYLYDSEIHKSVNDDREYRVIRLENGLESVLVYDAKTDKAAASMNVTVGSSCDPDDIPGLAHFCEHLMFMGTKQFPKENEYSEYLSKNNGDYNAFTMNHDTSYFFSVSSGALRGALERFSGFFHSPLFSESCTMREVDAVDSEFSMYLQDDNWRLYQLMRHHARPGHPLRKFVVGNRKTLIQNTRPAKSLNETRSSYDAQSKDPKNVNATTQHSGSAKEHTRNEEAGKRTRQRLIDWWDKEYGAERMQLAIVGKDSLDDLTDMVAKFFSPVKNRGQDPLPRHHENPYGEEQLGSIMYVKTVTDRKALIIAFHIPYQVQFWQVKPTQYLAHVIGYEGSGSLYAYLKHKGWLSALETGPEDLGRGATLFFLNLDLTKDGLKNYREVIRVCFKYLNLLCNSELPKWIQEELITLQALEFQYDEKISADHYASHISSHMQCPVPRALVLSSFRLTWGCDEELIRQHLADLTVENCFIIIACQDQSIIGKAGPWSREPWYGTQFMEEKLDNELIRAAHESNDIAEFSLPKRNDFVPTNIEVEKIEVSQPRKRPSLVRRTELMEVWHKKDDQFWIPRAKLMVEARTPVAGKSAKALVMTRLFAALVEDALNEYAYDAKIAGLDYDVIASIRGFTVLVGGYNDKLHILAEHVLEKVKNLDILEDRLEVMKEEYQQELSDMLLDEPYTLSEYYLSYLLLDRDFTVEEQLAETQGITKDKLHEHIKSILSRIRYKTLVVGNLKKYDALRIADKIEEIVDAKPVPAEQDIPACSRLLPESCNYIWELPVPNPEEINSSVSYYCHFGRVSDSRVRIMCFLLDKILEEPAFDTLRTKEQLGYMVSSSTCANIESIGWRIIIQSEKDPRYIESRIEAFLKHMQSALVMMDDNEFEEHKASLHHEWAEKLKNLTEECVRFWEQVRTGYLDFERQERDAELIKSVNKTQIIDMFNRFLDPSSSSRSKLSIHMRAQNPIPPKLSKPAADNFFSILRKSEYAINEDEYASLCEEMPAPQARGYWEEALVERFGRSHEAKKILAEFDKLVERYPQEGYVPVELGEKVVFIKDGDEFRRSLTLSAFAKPVELFEVE